MTSFVRNAIVLVENLKNFSPKRSGSRISDHYLLALWSVVSSEKLNLNAIIGNNRGLQTRSGSTKSKCECYTQLLSWSEVP